jgi:hypothetical protein
VILRLLWQAARRRYARFLRWKCAQLDLTACDGDYLVRAIALPLADIER